MATPVIIPELQFVDADGHPYAGGSLATFIVGTSTPKMTWVDPNMTAVQTNPAILDSAGRCLMWGDGDYRAILHDSAGNLVFDVPATTIVSAAMYPVISGSILNAQTLLGIDATAAADIAAETTARIAADNAEAVTRNNADVALSNALTSEANTRLAQDNAEATARTAADTNLQNQINVITGGVSTADIRAGATTTDGSGGFTLTFTPHFATAVAQIWVGYPPGVGEPTSGSPANPVSFPHITSHSVSGAAGILTDNNDTPIVVASVNWWAIGWVVALALFSGWT